jgi:hypothetical protein
MTNSAQKAEVRDALARLDQDIADAERRLAELRRIRDGAEPFLAYMETAFASSNSASQSVTQAEPTHATLADRVADIVKTRAPDQLSVDDVLTELRESGVETDATSTRNALYYAARRKGLRKVGRGRFTLDDSAPAATGAEVNEEPDY